MQPRRRLLHGYVHDRERGLRGHLRRRTDRSGALRSGRWHRMHWLWGVLQPALRPVRADRCQDLSARERLPRRRRSLPRRPRLLRGRRHGPPRRRQRGLRQGSGCARGHLPQPDRLQPRGQRLPLQGLRVRWFVLAQCLLRSPGELRRVPARSHRGAAVLRARYRLPRARRDLRLVHGLLQWRALRGRAGWLAALPPAVRWGPELRAPRW